MDGTQCPKCGSDQVLNDQCLKCGIVVSKHRGAQQAASPVSFVAPPGQPGGQRGQEYAIPQSAIEYQNVLRKRHRHTVLIGAAVLAAIVLAGYFLFGFLRQRASHTNGLYKNMKMLYATRFPEKDSAWNHYYPGQLDSPLYKGAGDAFYRGKDPDEPEIVFGAWVMAGPNLPEILDPAAARKLLAEAESELLEQMVDRGVDCTITDSRGIRVGGNDGFRMDNDISVNGKPMKLIALRGHYTGQQYWFFFSGSEEMMSAHSKEIESMILSLSYKMSMF